MPNVLIEMVEGRTIEQKRKLVSEVTEVIAKTLETDPNHVNIRFLNMKKEDLAKGGKLFVDL